MTQRPYIRGETERDRVAALRHADGFQRALRRRDRAGMVEQLRQLIALSAPMGEQWLQLAQIAVDLGEFADARAAIDLFVECCDGSSLARFAKAELFVAMGAFEEALNLLRALAADVPDPFTYALNRGSVALNVGELDEARQWTEEAIRLRLTSGGAWHTLALQAELNAQPGICERIVAAEPEMRDAPPAERAPFYYALAQAQAALGEYARAFAAASRAASDTKALYPDDPNLNRQTALEAVKGYDSARISAVSSLQSEPTARTVFVMGLPRSGTTLVEQILTSHGDISRGAEINLMRLLVHEAGDASFPALERMVARAGAPALARYWSHLIDGRFPNSRRVVDKTTDTSRKLGLVAALLPEAPLIWLKRDPLDCAWSCFRTCFMRGIRWSNDLKDMAFNFRLEDHLLAQWRKILGDRLLVVPYEELASGPEAWIRRILAHCGLAEEPAAFAPHENARTVSTASAMQVRRPINRAGIGSAEPYRTFLAPFIEAYYD